MVTTETESIEETVRLVQGSWAKVLPIADKVPEIFYPKLYELQPTTKPLFAHTSIPKQGAKLTKMLTKAVDGLSDLDQLVPKLEALGRRHAAYGVTDDMFAPVGQALIHTLAVGLGEDFTLEVRAAWLKVYGIICNVMQPAMRAELDKQRATSAASTKDADRSASIAALVALFVAAIAFCAAVVASELETLHKRLTSLYL